MFNDFDPMCNADKQADIAQDAHKCDESAAVNSNAAFWRTTIKPSSWVLDWVENGVPLHWEHPDVVAPPCTLPNHPGAHTHSEFVNDAVEKLFKAGAVRVCTTRPRCVHPLNVVPKKNGKLRLILDLREVNKFLKYIPFKFEHLGMVEFACKQGDYLCSLDLTNAYWQLKMRDDAHTYLGFHWNNKYYVFTVLPFGLSTAPWVFSETARELCSYLRAHGVALINYIDDFCFFLGPNALAASQCIAWVIHVCKCAGFCINAEKSVTIPCFRLECLGFMIDTQAGMFEITDKRWQQWCAAMTAVLDKSTILAKTLARVTGHLASFKLVLGDLMRLQTRATHRCLSVAASLRRWHIHVPVSIESRVELDFWAQCPRSVFSRPIWKADAYEHTHEVSTDASATGWAGVLPGAVAQGVFTPVECATGSGNRELLAIQNTLSAFLHVLQKHENARVLLRTDSQNAFHIIRKGSRHPHLHKLAVAVADFCLLHNIQLRIVWVPRAQNTTADFYSKLPTWESDWQMPLPLFHTLCARWGAHTFDRFASHSNTLCDRFNSLYFCPGTSGVDAMFTHWGGEHNWVNPPFVILDRCIDKIIREQAHCTLIVPVWHSAVWWPRLVQRDGQFQAFVSGTYELPNAYHLLPWARSGHPWGVGTARWRMLALNLFAPCS